MNEDKHIPKSLDEWLNEWVVEHKNIEYKEPIIKIDYQYMLTDLYKN